MPEMQAENEENNDLKVRSLNTLMKKREGEIKRKSIRRSSQELTQNLVQKIPEMEIKNLKSFLKSSKREKEEFGLKRFEINSNVYNFI